MDTTINTDMIMGIVATEEEEKKRKMISKKKPYTFIRMLPSYLERMEKVDVAIEANYEIIKIICEDQQIFVNEDRSTIKLDMNERSRNAAALRIRQQDMEKVQGTIKQFVRDWSEEGKPEREAIYGPMVQELKDRFNHIPEDKRGGIHVLVPGSGLG
ncbi:hypothetical protein BGZ65_010197, partial [Modicella reniformis]